MQKYDPRHAARVQGVINSGIGTGKIVQVPCYRLADLLHEHGVKRIDLLSLDIEGGEFDVLQTFDFSSVDIDVITVENNFHDHHIRIFLAGKGYRLLAVAGVDEIYRRIR